jgi:hypothetical protein
MFKYLKTLKIEALRSCVFNKFSNRMHTLSISKSYESLEKIIEYNNFLTLGNKRLTVLQGSNAVLYVHIMVLAESKMKFRLAHFIVGLEKNWSCMHVKYAMSLFRKMCKVNQ